MHIEKKISFGSQADIFLVSFLNEFFILKKFRKKDYMPKKLNDDLIKKRAKQETKILNQVNGLLNSPKVFFFIEDEIYMQKLSGKTTNLLFSKYNLEKKKKLIDFAAKSLAKLHEKGIIHGDFTLANIMDSENKFYLIDFGLSFYSLKNEDMAFDLITFCLSLSSFSYDINDFLNKYEKYRKSKEVIKQTKNVLSRVRYVSKS